MLYNNKNVIIKKKFVFVVVLGFFPHILRMKGYSSGQAASVRAIANRSINLSQKSKTGAL